MTAPSGWRRREVDTNIVVIGDAPGQMKSIWGLLIAITPDRRYPDNSDYELVLKDGTSKLVAGSASINSMLGKSDIGKFVKLTFEGWQQGRGNQWKKVAVDVFDGEVTDAMRKYPRYDEAQAMAKRIADQSTAKAAATTGKAAAGPGDPGSSLDAFPEQLDEEDDDLPF